MLTRLLFLVLIVIAWVLLVRFVKSWYAANRVRTDGDREIAGEWKVVKPLGQIPEQRLVQLAEIMEIENHAATRTIAKSIEVAVRAQLGPDIDHAEAYALADGLEQVGDLPLFDGSGVVAMGWLSLAAEFLGNERPDLAIYERKRAVRVGVECLYPDVMAPFFPPERSLALASEAKTAPPRDARYTVLATASDSSGQLKTLRDLMDIPAAGLPSEAMDPLLRLYQRHGSGADEPITDLTGQVLARYGERLLPHVIEMLCKPLGEDPADGHLSRIPILKLCSGWSRECIEPLFRAAIESGWNEAAACLPDERWAQDLVTSFVDSPYGPPSYQSG